MSENCNHDCSSCGENCSSRQMSKEDFIEKPNAGSTIRRVVGIVSGKGGVGKSMITSMLAVALRRKGVNVGILDADITGPSIPKTFGLTEKAYANEQGVLPVFTKTGMPVMSLNLMLEDDTDPVVWRGPVIAGVVKQFWTDVLWGDLDVLLIDMPPGTGDVPLTVFQSIPMDGIIIVSTPQELVGMIVDKAVNMAGMMDIPVLGLVENMSYLKCPDCGKEIEIFGKSRLASTAESHGIVNTAKIPIIPEIAANADNGNIELTPFCALDNMADFIMTLPDNPRG